MTIKLVTPDRLIVRVGSLTIESTDHSHATIKLNGVEVPCFALTLKMRANALHRSTCI